MMYQAGLPLGIDVTFMDKASDVSCGSMKGFVEGDYRNYDDIMRFGKDRDVLTTEIEDVNLDALEDLVFEGKLVYPQSPVIRVMQDKSAQKEYFRGLRIPTASYRLVSKPGKLVDKDMKYPVVQKLLRGGYDGRGVHFIRSASDLKDQFSAPSLLEDLVSFKKELGIMGVRNIDGETRVFEPSELVFHEDVHLLDYQISPILDMDIRDACRDIVFRLMEKLRIVGVLAVEMFLTHDNKVLVNEMAARPHNCGHHTIDTCLTSQFEQHMRAICDLPLGKDKRLDKNFSIMVNLVGQKGYEEVMDATTSRKVMSMENTKVHLYGKGVRPNRKMGHITMIDDSMSSLMERKDRLFKLMGR